MHVRLAAIGALGALLALVTPAHAARLAAKGWDTCDETEESEIIVAGASTIETSLIRSGRCALRVAKSNGTNGGHRVPNTGVNELYSTVYSRVVDLPSTTVAEGGHWNTSNGFYLCRYTRAADNSLTLGFKNATYAALGTTAPLVQACSIDKDCNGGECRSGQCWHNIGVHTKLQSGTPACASNCQVLCELTVDSIRLASGTVDVSSSDYVQPTATVVGYSGSDAGTATTIFDDLRRDTSTDPGAGRLAVLVPDGVGSSTQWGNGGNTGNCGAGASKFGCVDDLPSGSTATHDSASSYLDNATNGQTQDLTLDLPAAATLATGESVTAATVVSIAAEQTSGTRNYRVNLTNAGASVVTGATCETLNDLSYAACVNDALATMPGGGAWSLANLAAQIEKTSSGTNRVTAILVYADIRMPDPQIRQNLQDWAKLCGGGSNAGNTCASNADCPSGVCYQDGVLAIYTPGDSITAGTGQGACQFDASVPCSFSSDCAPPTTGTDIGPCLNSSKWPSVVAGLATQKIGTRATAVLSCGINGNQSADLVDRLPTMLTGAGMVARRYCQESMPTTCTCTSGSGLICSSTDCVNEMSGGPDCMLSCSATAGSAVCAGNHRVDCSANADCSGSRCIGGSNQDATCTVASQCPSGVCVAGGNCTDYPAADYVAQLIGANDMHLTFDPGCNFGGFTPPCPPVSTATPAKTPAPGDGYFVQRVSCAASTECADRCVGGLFPGASCSSAGDCPSGTCPLVAGLCTGNLQKACDSAGDCTGVGTCSTTLRLPGNAATCTSTCSNDATRACGLDGQCRAPGTCNSASKMCTNLCTRVPCATDADCGPTSLVAFDGRTMLSGMFGTCSNGLCTNCGRTGGNTRQFRQYQAARDPGIVTLPNFDSEAATIAAAGRRFVLLTPSLGHEILTLSGWAGAKDVMRKLRNLMLTRYPNVIDVWTHWKAGDQMMFARRCNTNPATICASDSECAGAGALCLPYNSTLRPQQSLINYDEIHLDAVGGPVIGRAAGAYLNALAPRCSGDPTTGCGKCSTTTATTCTSSDDCPTGEKCVATDTVCSGAGKGACTQERIGNRCTTDLATTCATNADCAAKQGLCRPEGLLAEGDG